MWDHAQAGPDAQIPWRNGSCVCGSHSCYNTFSLQVCLYGFVGSSLWSELVQRQGRLRSCVLMVPHQRRAPLESGQLQHDRPFLGHPWRTMVKGNPPREQNFQAMDLIVHFALKEKWPDTWLYTDSWDVANDLAGLSRTWKGYDWKIGDKEVSGRDMDRYVLDGWKMWRYL